MKIKGPFMKVVSLNEVVKHSYLNQILILDFFLFILDFSISILFNKHNFP
jgi:hypothetical protein